MPNYATIAEAQTYFDRVLNTRVWDCASTNDRNKALSQATDIIDRLNFLGCKTDEAQENQFPRSPDTVIPTDIKNASAAIALALLDGVDPQIEYENIHLRSKSYGPLKSTYEQDSFHPHLIAGVPSITAWRFLNPYLRDPNTVDIFRTS